MVGDVNDNAPYFPEPKPVVTIIEEDDRDLPLVVAKVISQVYFFTVLYSVYEINYYMISNTYNLNLMHCIKKLCIRSLQKTWTG